MKNHRNGSPDVISPTAHGHWGLYSTRYPSPHFQMIVGLSLSPYVLGGFSSHQTASAFSVFLPWCVLRAQTYRPLQHPQITLSTDAPS